MHIAEHYSGNIGRMFARQNVPTVYGRQDKDGALAKESGLTGLTDTVELSAFRPQPLSASLFEDAWKTGESLGSGNKPTEEQSTRIREDRVFAAIAAMTMMGMKGDEADPRLGWPGGIPTPTPQEMDEARRRLSQRLQRLEASENQEQVQ